MRYRHHHPALDNEIELNQNHKNNTKMNAKQNIKAEKKPKTRQINGTKKQKTKEIVLLSARFALPFPTEARRMQKKDSTLQL